MIVALDVHYFNEGALHADPAYAIAAAVGFQDWRSSEPIETWTARVENIEPYEPGKFFKRELPCLNAVIEKIDYPVGCWIVDGHVWLDNGQPGLGHYLHRTFKHPWPVIGVAKRAFRDGGQAIEVVRGKSKAPLYVTSIKCNPDGAADFVRKMHGDFRIPTMLKLVDHLCRGLS